MKEPMRRGMVLASLAALTALVPSLAGRVRAEPTLAEERPWAVMPEIAFAPTPPTPLPGYLVVGLTVQRAFAGVLLLDATVGRALPASALAHMADGSTGEVSLDPGTSARLLLRRAFPLDQRGQGALGVGLGPAVFAGGAFGTVVLLRAEGGLDWRAPSGLTALIAVGYDLSLSESKRPIASAACITEDCPRYFRRGRGQPSTRVAVGYAF
jgi:hypothetical protein